MTSGVRLDRLWRRIGFLTLILTIAGAVPLIAFGLGRVALGMAIGACLFTADIYLLKAPLDLMLRRVEQQKRAWVMTLSLARIVVLAGVLFVLVRFHIASPFGLFIGVTLPILAIAALFATGRLWTGATDGHR